MTDDKGTPESMGGASRPEDCQALLEQAPVGIARFDREGRYLYANPANAHLLGVEAQAWADKTEEELGLPAAWLAGWQAARRQAVEAAQVTQTTLSLSAADSARRDGVRYYDLIAVPEKGADGSVATVARYLRDVTARKQTDDQRAFLITVLDSMADEVWFADTEGNLSMANRAAVEGLGLQRDGQIFQPVPQGKELEALTPDGQPRPPDQMPLLRSLRGEVIHGEEEIARYPQTGELRYRQVSSAPVRNGAAHTGGDIIGAVAIARDVTEQERDRRALQESEERLRALYEQAAIGIKQVDLGGRILNANQKLADILGYTREELVGRSLAELTHPDDWPAEQGLLARLQTGQIPSYTLEKRYRRQDGQEIWGRATTALARGARQPYYITVVEEIGARKEAERQREETLEALQLASGELAMQNEQLIEARNEVEAERRRYQDLFELAPDGYLVTDREGVIREANRSAGALLGAHAEQLVGRRLEEYFRDDRPGLRELLDRLQHRGRVDDQQVMLRPSAGTDRPQRLPVSVTATVARDERGKMTGVRWIMRDIRERVAAERERERLLAQVEAEQARLQAVLETLPVGVSITDPHGRILRVNRALNDLWGRAALSASPEEYSEGYQAWWPGTGRQVQANEWGLARAIARGEFSGPEELEIQASNGQHKTILSYARPVRDAAGIVIGGVAVNVDITDRKRAEEALQELNETLEQRVAERTMQLRALAAELSRAEENERRRLARVLHDHLQQLLVAARLNLTSLQRRIEHTPLAATAGRIDEVLQEAIDTSRSLTAELSPPVLYDAGLTAALHWLARWMQEKHGLQVEIVADEVGAESPEGARAMAFQAVRELLFNVVKHAGVKKARVDLRRMDNEIELTVSDLGVGFDPAQIGRKPEGGFGLFSIRERLELLGGRMRVESEPGQGTRVALRVPLRPAEGEEATAAAEEAALRIAGGGRAREKKRTGDGQAVRVLLVDDHVIVREGLARLLEDEPGIELVGEASDGRQAVALAQMARPDVVLMDVSMPVMDGVEATRRILKAAPNIKVIGLSMHEKGEIAQRMREAGAVDYISKGGDPAGLLRTVLRWGPGK